MQTTTMTREELAEANRKLVEAMRAKAEADTITLRDNVRTFLNSKLPGQFRVEPLDVKVWGDQIEKRLLVVAHDGETFTLRFYVVQKSSRWGRNSTFEPCISGSDYQRERRTFRPVYARRKDGTHNLAAMLGDIERCIAHKRYQTALREAQNNSMAASFATLRKVRFALSGTDGAATQIHHDAGPLQITVSAGQYSSGAVRVQVKLRDEYLSAEAATALITKLETLK